MAITENKWGIIYCPKGGYRNHKRWKKIKDCLHDNAIDFDYVQSENTDSVDRLVKMMINNSYKTIIIVGGDSALNDAVNCLMSVDAQVRDSVALGVIPNGTMNDFAHFWGFDEVDYEQTIKWLKAGRIRKVDLGCIRYVNRDHDNCHRYFLNCVNIGLLSTVTDRENLSLNRNVDLKRINARQLEEIGVEKIDICPYCTSCNNDLFYSYRKENGTKERHYAVMMI